MRLPTPLLTCCSFLVRRILSEANLSSSTLESVAASLRTFFAKADYFRVGNALVGHLLLTHRV